MGNDSRQHGFEIERRADRLTNFTQCSQLTDRAPQFLCSRLQFLKQPDVLHRDPRLVGKSFEKCNLPVRERTHFRATDCDGTDGDPFTKPWNGQTGPNAQAMDGMPDICPVLFAFGPDVVSMNWLPIEYG